MVDLTPDGVALSIAPKKADDTVDVQDTVTFRGWLGDGEGPDAVRLYTSPWGEQWLELKRGDVVHRISGEHESSFIWVKADAKITRCVAGTALHFGEKGIDESDDPTIGERVPRY